jgi:hypothetical protein
MEKEMWYLKWNSSITEDIFNQIIKAFEKEGRKFYYHYGEGEYQKFKSNGFIRTSVGGESGNAPGEGWCIDNNKQTCKKELFVSDILGEKQEPVKENKFSNGNIVVIVANTTSSSNKIGEIGKWHPNMNVLVHGGPTYSVSTHSRDIRHATETEKKAYEAGCKTLEEYEKQYPTPKPVSPPGCVGIQAKYNIGDEVVVCDSKMDKGWGWQGTEGSYSDYVQGLSGTRGEVTSLKWNEKRTEWSYRVGNTGWFAEHAISLINKPVQHTVRGDCPVPSPYTPKQMDLSNTKIWIGNNPDLSRRVQEALFEKGCEWTKGRVVQFTEAAVLYITSNLSLSYASTDSLDFKASGTKKFTYGDRAREIFPSDLGIIMTGSHEEEDKKIIEKFSKWVDEERIWKTSTPFFEEDQLPYIIIKEPKEKQGMVSATLQSVVLIKEPPHPKLIIA